MTVKLDDWSFVANNWKGCQRFPYMDEFQAPVPGSCLFGRVFGHKKIEDGHRAHTSIVEKIDGRLITTKTGTIYELCDVYSDYDLWMRENGWACAGQGWF